MLAFFRFIKFYNEGEITMVSVRKRGKVYEYRIKNHVKPRVGFYKLWQLDTRLLQEFINKIYVEYGFSKNYMISLVLKALNEFRNEAIGKGRYTDCIDELM